MNTNITTTTNERLMAREERLRAAMKVLLDYLLEQGYLDPVRHATNHVSAQAESADSLLVSSTLEET